MIDIDFNAHMKEPGRQRTWYWVGRTNKSLLSNKKDLKYIY